MKKWLLAGSIIGGSVVVDQATKYWAEAALNPLNGGRTITVVPNVLFMDYATNTGAAFSVFTDRPGLLTAVAATVSVMVGVWLWRTPANERWAIASLSLILGGAVGNLIDRARIGHVIDFVRVHFAFADWSWPTFNVADSCICVGMGALMVVTFRAAAREEKQQRAEAAAERNAAASANPN